MTDAVIPTPEPEVGSTAWLRHEVAHNIEYARFYSNAGYSTNEEQWWNMQRAAACASLAASYATIAEIQTREIDRIIGR